MLEKRHLEELAAYDGETPVLTVYAATDLAREPKEAAILAVKNSLKELGDGVPPAEVERVQRYLDYEYDWQSRGVALYGAGDDLWRAIALPAPVPTRAYYTDAPYIREAVDLVDRFGEYVVALVDRTALRLFTVRSGAVYAETEAVGEGLKRHRQGGWAAARYQRHEDNLALHNLKQAVEVIRTYCEEIDCRRLMLAGSTDVLAQLKDLLPAALRERVVGEFAADMESSPAEILARSTGVLDETADREDRRLVEEAVTAAGKGGAGVTGLADVLYALRAGRVRLLLVDEGFSAPGYTCGHCGYVAAELSPTCPFCRSEGMAPVPDAVNRAILQSVLTGVDVNVVRGDGALVGAGRIAALLRY
jgi:peptide chain release factor subunit 1